MAVGGAAPPRGRAAAAAANLRRRRTAGGGTAAGGAAGNVLQFYTDDVPGLKISPNVVVVMSIGFIAFVAILHVIVCFFLLMALRKGNCHYEGEKSHSSPGIRNVRFQ
ncbi:hypothetical protein RHSIM_Rhsim01G0019700 [Rhododendron simsii]|uniref:Protein transport protein Sec61 subunit beta n=1 Tax=Rhododendron simsii TaxID=118357 RepID=A0A834HT01_RHOSS|nr:hypothetical protein RHSIM_Rhsim01G0019700 [Rhododendron simsii]